MARRLTPPNTARGKSTNRRPARRRDERDIEGTSGVGSI
jgi:hypothetical protein